jgi:hypothetical protein
MRRSAWTCADIVPWSRGLGWQQQLPVLGTAMGCSTWMMSMVGAIVTFVAPGLSAVVSADPIGKDGRLAFAGPRAEASERTGRRCPWCAGS